MKQVIQVKQIIEQLNEVFATMDQKVLVASQEWAQERIKALNEFWESEEYAELKKTRSNNRYYRNWEIAGGKGWYNTFVDNSDESIKEFIIKNCKAIADKRNLRIAKKLEEAGITKIISNTITHTQHGFDGLYIIETNQGEKTVKIETVWAGGYNVQCLHLRVLIKIK